MSKRCCWLLICLVKKVIIIPSSRAASSSLCIIVCLNSLASYGSVVLQDHIYRLTRSSSSKIAIFFRVAICKEYLPEISGSDIMTALSSLLILIHVWREKPKVISLRTDVSKFNHLINCFSRVKESIPCITVINNSSCFRNTNFVLLFSSQAIRIELLVGPISPTHNSS